MWSAKKSGAERRTGWGGGSVKENEMNEEGEKSRNEGAMDGRTGRVKRVSAEEGDGKEVGGGEKKTLEIRGVRFRFHTSTLTA